MQKHIGIAVPHRTLFMVQRQSTNHELFSFSKLMHVVPVSNAETHTSALLLSMSSEN